MACPIVTLTTDWGENSFFAGMVKGRLYSTIPDVRVVDVCHTLKPFDLIGSPLVIQNSCMDFPKGTVHIIDILSEEQSGQGFLVVQHKSQYYICTNNGLPHIVFGSNYEKAVELTPYWSSPSYNFAAYDIFCPIAAKIAAGAQLSDLGCDATLLEKRLQLYMVMGNIIKTHVWHIDSYGNAYLDIKNDDFLRELDGHPFELVYRSTRVGNLYPSYADCVHPSLTVSATGYLEIAMYKQRAADVLGISLYDIVDIVKK